MGIMKTQSGGAALGLAKVTYSHLILLQHEWQAAAVRAIKLCCGSALTRIQGSNKVTGPDILSRHLVIPLTRRPPAVA